MSNLKIITIVLAAVLIASIAGNIYLVTQNQYAKTEANYVTRINMVEILNQIQVRVDTELDRIGQSLIYAAEQLGTAGITGSQTDTILSELALNSTFIIDAGTQDLANIMVAVEPAEYKNTIGQNVGEQKWLNTNPDGDITPVMSPVIAMIEGFSGNSIAVPVFNSAKVQIGVVSVIFNPQELLQASIEAVTQDTQYEFTVMQPNGLILFDSHIQEMVNFFTEATNTEILTVGQQIVQTSSGYSTYTVSSDQAKQCYWITISAYGEEWRLIVHHTI
ncbi:MAG: hypothetical protein IAX22_06385 [Candidatus Bathyarchaeota archaeon]|nr:hypothetical protein [Candidatus Bathyarchaeota archaeon]